MSTTRASFVSLFEDKAIRDTLLSYTAKKDVASLRLVCQELSIQTAPCLFSNVEIEFRSSSFTRPTRMAALERIGGFIKSLTFCVSHSSETFLPPLLDPHTGEEQTFIYIPQVHSPQSSGSRLSIPKYGSWAMTDLLTKQYPPLFHAATNVPAFIRAFKAVPYLTHLTISCKGQSIGHRYRRSIVDYALISLRIAIEQAPLVSLRKLSLVPIHPGALLYLRHSMGFGTSPAARKRWMQIRKLEIHMDSFPIGNGTSTDHLKLLHSYLEGFPSLRKFTFCWLGEKGPCPLTLPTESCLQVSSESKTANPKARPRKRQKQGLQTLKFPNLRHLKIRNVAPHASQLSTFMLGHGPAIREIKFEETSLRSGTWDEALAPLARTASGSGRRKKKPSPAEVMDVPIVLSPVGMDVRQLQKAIMEQTKRKTRTRPLQAYANLQRTTSRTRELLLCGPDHLKRLMRSSAFSWR